MAPPSPVSARLFVIMEFVTVNGPDVIMAPPLSPALLLFNVELWTVNFLGQLYKAPPHSLARLFSNIQFAT